MSGRRALAVASATVTLLVFVVLPLMAPKLIPPEFTEVLSQSGLNLEELLKQVAMIGVAMAGITLAQGFLRKSSPLYLVLSVASSAATLVFSFVLLGLGDIRSLGMNSVSVEIPNGTSSIVIDMRLFVRLSALAVVLKVVHTVLEFTEARRELEQPGRIPP